MLSLFKFQRRRFYWQIRNAILLLKFQINKLFFHSNRKIREAKEEVSITSQITWATSRVFVLSILLVAVVELLEKLLLILFPADKLFFLINAHKLIVESSNSLDNFLVTIASVLGVFLGLYFTATSIVASSAYMAVPSDVRELLLKEKIGNAYIRMLSILLATSVVLLGYRIFHHYPGVLITILMLIFGCVSIFAFIILASRVFSFFDPTILVDAVFNDLYTEIRLASVKGLKWFDINFQSHYHKVASRSISTLNNLVEVCIKTPNLYKKSMPSLSWKICYFLKYYQAQKALIPTDSYWFARIPKYKDIFTVDDSSLMIALQTQTSIQPDLITNNYWLEDEIIDILAKILQAMIKANSISTSAEILDGINKYIEDLGENLEVKKCSEICNKIKTILEDYFLKLSATENKKMDYMNFALFDRYNLLPMSCAIGFYKLNREFKMSLLILRTDQILWKKKRSIYQSDFFPIILGQLEYLQKGLEFEKEVEGDIISPIWYRRQLVSIKFGQFINESIESMLNSFKQFYIDGSNALSDSKSVILTTYRIRRGLEAFSKMRANLASIKEEVKNLEKFNIEKELYWPKWDWDKLIKQIGESHSKLIELQAKCLPSLSMIDKADNEPDLFGETYHNICQGCFTYLANNKADKFCAIFPFLFLGSLQASDRLRIAYKNRDAKTLILLSFQPLSDLIALSGYSKIYSELYATPSLWELTQKLWDNYLNVDHTKKEAVIKYIVTSYQYKKSQFGLFPRDILKTNWKMELNNKLREMGLIKSRFDADDYPLRGKGAINHKSPLIRTFCRGRYEPFITAGEIFLLIYFVKQHKVTDFADNHNFIRHLDEESNAKNA